MPISLPLPTAELQLPTVPNPDRHARAAESSASGLVQSVSPHAANDDRMPARAEPADLHPVAMQGNAVPGRTKSALGIMRKRCSVSVIARRASPPRCSCSLIRSMGPR